MRDSRTPAAVAQRPSLPPHPRDEPAQRRRPGARRAALFRAPLAADDDALRPDAAATHEREFLRYHKITADARDLAVDPRDLYDLLELDQRADRVLPNGYCMLPPRQVCERGNACLTCDKFATDASFLDEHEQQLGRLVDLIAQRQARSSTAPARTMGARTSGSSNASASSARSRRSSPAHRARAVGHPDQAVRGAGTSARAANHPRRGTGRVRALLIPASGRSRRSSKTASATCGG